MSASSPRILVTCHANADFDSFAAMLGWQMLNAMIGKNNCGMK